MSGVVLTDDRVVGICECERHPRMAKTVGVHILKDDGPVGVYLRVAGGAQT